MATLESLPNELLGPIIKNLCDEDRKIHHFDPVGVKDLQHVRLVSRRMSTLATPHLFENMILDEKLLTEEHVTRISKFAENNPSLALHVRRLQRRLSPLIIDPEYHCNYYIDYILNDAFDLESVYDRSHWRRFMQILVARCEIDQQREEVSSSGPALGCCSRSRTSFLRTIKALPNLIHVENTRSRYWLPYLKAAVYQFAEESGICLDDYLDHEKVLSPIGPLVHLYSHLPELNTPTVKSLKLLEMPLPIYFGDWSDSLRSLEHLDVECSLAETEYVTPEEGERKLMITHARRWRSEFQNLTNLRTLRLTGPGEWGTVYALAKPRQDDAAPVHIDDLLQGGELPHLNALSLINWPVREPGLVNIIRRHRDNLKTLELRRLSLDVSHLGAIEGVNVGWRRIAATCAECCTIKRFSFKELRIHIICNEEGDSETRHSGFARLDSAGIQELYRVARGL